MSAANTPMNSLEFQSKSEEQRLSNFERRKTLYNRRSESKLLDMSLNYDYDIDFRRKSSVLFDYDNLVKTK